MTPFSALLAGLTAPGADQAATLAAWLRAAAEPDRMAALALLSRHRPKRSATADELRHWACAVAAVPDWLYEAALAASGDRAETTALLLPAPEGDAPRLSDTLNRLAALPGQPEPARRAAIVALWASLPTDARLMLNRLAAGTFRTHLPPAILGQALAAVTGLPAPGLALRLAEWDGRSQSWDQMIGKGAVPDLAPLPFAAPQPLIHDLGTLGPATDWIIEAAPVGLACQLVARHGNLAIWTPEGALLDVPELRPLVAVLPSGTVLLGTLTAPPNRLAAVRPSRALWTRSPARLLARDVLELAGQDLRAAPFAHRRARLAMMLMALPGRPLDLAAVLPNWTVPRSGGLILTPAQSLFPGPHWHLAPTPHTLTAVMIYAEAGHPPPGTSGTSGPEITLALWHQGAPLPVARTRLTLPDTEQREILTWVRANTLERFGPLRRVPPDLVFDLEFAAASAAPRRKSGLALTNPRLLRWRRDGVQAQTLSDLRESLALPTPDAE